MSARDETIALVTRYYEAFNTGNDEAMLACLADSIVHDINQGERQIGKDAFRTFLVKMGHAYRERLSDIAIMANEDGTRASAEFLVHGTYLQADEGLPPAHGQSYVLPAGAFFDIPDGAISRVTVYYNLADWIAQVSAAKSDGA